MGMENDLDDGLIERYALSGFASLSRGFDFRFPLEREDALQDARIGVLQAWRCKPNQQDSYYISAACNRIKRYIEKMQIPPECEHGEDLSEIEDNRIRYDPGLGGLDDDDIPPMALLAGSACTDLPTQERVIIQMRFGLGEYEWHSWDEIVDALDMSMSTVQRRYAAGMSTLRAIMRADEILGLQ